MSDYISLIKEYDSLLRDYVSLDVRIVSASYKENPESVTKAALKYVGMLAPNDQDAQTAILMAVQYCYWRTEIAVSEIRDLYAPGLPTSAVVTIAGSAKLNIVCRRCGGSLYVTSRTSFNEMNKRLSHYNPKYALWDICPDCRVHVTEEVVLREGAVLRGAYITNPGEDEPREDRDSSTATAYPDYAQTADWKIRQEGALKRAGFSCQVCSGKGELHVHHRTYLTQDYEAEMDFLVLCVTCHKLLYENGRLAQGDRTDT